METRIGKGRDGWTATTDVDLGESRLLRIETRKSYRGGVEAVASVMTRDGNFLTHRMGIGGGGDYRKAQVSNPDARCTEKTVRQVHETALSCLDAIKGDVLVYYKAQEVSEVVA